MKIVTICDDFYHPGLPFEEAIRYVKPNEEHTFIYKAGDVNKNTFDDCDLLIIARSDVYKWGEEGATSWLVGDIKDAFLSYINKGKGLLILHSGIVGYAQDDDLANIFSGYFDFHPPQCNVKIEAVEVSEIMKDIEPYEYIDEHYHLIMKDDDIDMFAKTVSSHGEQPGGWFKTTNNKKICALIMGHTKEMLESDGYREMLKRAIEWFMVV